MSDIIIQIIIACPDLLNVVLSKMESSAQPKESKKWDLLMMFVENVGIRETLLIVKAVNYFRLNVK